MGTAAAEPTPELPAIAARFKPLSTGGNADEGTVGVAEEESGGVGNEACKFKAAA